MNIDVPSDDDDDVLYDLGVQVSGCIDRAVMFERQAEELLQRAARSRRKAARLEQVADYIRQLKTNQKD